jgi:hypothetical protein
MNQDGEAVEREKLLGLRSGHSSSEASSGEDYEYLHDG